MTIITNQIKKTNGNYIEYESKGDENKYLLPEEYHDMIRPYLSDIINDHKNLKKLRVYLGNKVLIMKFSIYIRDLNTENYFCLF